MPDFRHSEREEHMALCGELEWLVQRLWDPDKGSPPPDVAAAERDFSELEPELAVRLGASLEVIWLGELSIGYVARRPSGAHGRVEPLGGGRVAPARRLVAHALCDLDGLASSVEWRAVYRLCAPMLAYTPALRCPRAWWAESFARAKAGPLAEVLGGDVALARCVAAYHRRIVGEYMGT